MKQALLALALATLALGACDRAPAPQPAPATDAAAETAATTPAATDTVDVADDASPAASVAAFDSKAFAGRFAASDSSLEVLADGSYRREDANVASDGTWTLEADGKHILLDPNSKASADRRYEIVGQDELVEVDGSQRLRREGTGQ